MFKCLFLGIFREIYYFICKLVFFFLIWCTNIVYIFYIFYHIGIKYENEILDENILNDIFLSFSLIFKSLFSICISQSWSKISLYAVLEFKIIKNKNKTNRLKDMWLKCNGNLRIMIYGDMTIFDFV